MPRRYGSGMRKEQRRLSRRDILWKSYGRMSSNITPLEKDLNTFYDKFHRKGKSVDSNEWGLVYHNVPLGLSKDFKIECEKIINENGLNLKAELVSENGVFVNQCVVSNKY